MINQFNVSLWGDEAFSATLSQKSIPQIITTIAHDTSPPLYNILEHIWFNLFGNSEIAIRALSFLFLAIAIFFVFKIGEYYWDKKTGLLAALFTFLNPFFFTYAFEGRMYSLLAATITASFYFFIKKKWVPYIIFGTAALYTHHFAIFAIFIQGLWFLKRLLFEKDKETKNNLYAFIAVGILYIPWLIPLYNQTKMVETGFWLSKPTLIDLKELIYKYLTKGIPNNLNNVALWTSWAVLILRKWNKQIEKTIFLIFWFILPIVITWVISQKFQSIFFDRYLLYTIPAAMLILVSNKRQFSSIPLALLLSFFLITDYNYFTHPTKPPFRDLAQYLQETKKGDDYLINWNGKAHHLWESKYYGLNAPIYLPKDQPLPYFTGTALMKPDDTVASLPTKAYRIGVITSESIDEVNLPGYTKKDIHNFGNLKLIWFRK